MTRLSTRSRPLAAALVMPNTAMLNAATWAASQNTRTPVLPGSWNIPQRTPMVSTTVDNNSDLLRAGYVFSRRLGDSVETILQSVWPRGVDTRPASAMTGERVTVTAQ